MPEKNTKLVWLCLYAISMAQVEASIVIHLRSIYYPGNPLSIFPLSLLSHRDLFIELAREVATMLMILSVSILAAKEFTRRFAAFLLVFGMWDIFYYFWLKVMIGWPVSWLEWDVLFLIPWPWLGPWIAPALVALLWVVWGGWVYSTRTELRFTVLTFSLLVVGAVLSLVAFLLPAYPLLGEGEQAFAGYQPGTFSWWLYGAGYLLMACSLIYASISTGLGNGGIVHDK